MSFQINHLLQRAIQRFSLLPFVHDGEPMAWGQVRALVTGLVTQDLILKRATRRLRR